MSGFWVDGDIEYRRVLAAVLRIRLEVLHKQLANAQLQGEAAFLKQRIADEIRDHRSQQNELARSFF